MGPISPCPHCGGADDACTGCGGTNQVQVYRCPRVLAGPDEQRMVQACALVEQGHLPDPGGWQDQAATFVQGYPWVMREIHHWRQVAAERAAERAKRKRQ